MRPLDRLPLCGMASTSPPVFPRIGIEELPELRGIFAVVGGERHDLVGLALSSRKITLRWRLFPPLLDVHS